MKKLAAILLGLLLAFPAYSQTRVVKGKITAFNQYPVQNIEVASKKGKSAVVTDSLGQFELVCKAKDVILIKTQAFEPLNMRITSKDEDVTANLVFKDSEKNRELVTSLGYMEADQLSYALVHLTHFNNDFCNYTDIISLIMAKFPEAQVTGNGNGVYFRGQKTMSAESSMESEAVYEVDGMRVSDITFINPCEIAKIEVMKSGGTALYGTQSINGVVIIKTKASMVN